MNGNDLSSLSYKELQALAMRFRVPGNIKKQVLVRVLEAAQQRDDREVARLLTELKQTRKKRGPRKMKASKLGLTSTPIHSPTYNVGDDYYRSPQQLPYQWVGAEEEITSRDDEANRVPQYEEFRQFLLRRIQRLDPCDSNNNDSVEPSVADLGSLGDPLASSTKSNTVAGSENRQQAELYSGPIAHSNVEYQILGDSNSNLNVPILLRRMLQAPVGANLGAIASPESRGYRLWPLEYPSLNNDPLNNSDTLTADSDSRENNENWPIDEEYYRFMNTVKDQMCPDQSYMANRNAPQVGQLCNTLARDNDNRYQYVYPDQASEVQQNCRQWVTGSAFESRESDYPDPGDQESPQTFRSVRYEGNGLNDVRTMSGPSDNDQSQFRYRRNDGGVIYKVNQTAFEASGSVVSRPETQYYQDQSQSAVRQDQAEVYYPQQLMGQTEEANTAYFKPIHPVSSYQTVVQQEAYMPPPVQQVSTAQHQMPSHCYKYSQEEANSQPQTIPNDLSMHYRLGFYQQYNIHPQNQSSGFPPMAQEPYQQNRSNNVDPAQEANAQNNFETQMESNSMQQTLRSNVVLDPYYPTRLPSNSQSYLENILNLQACGYVDYSKIDQTSCIYCYTAPIVSQRPFAPNSSCSQKRRFISEFRQHTFSPKWLMYSDSSTGMRMSRTTDVGEQIEEYIEDEEIARAVNSNAGTGGSSDVEESIEHGMNETPSEWLLSESGKQYSDNDLVVDEDSNGERLLLGETEVTAISIQQSH